MEERIKKAMGKTLQDFAGELREVEKDMQELQKGSRLALSLYEIAQSIDPNETDSINNIKFVMLENLQNDFLDWFKSYKNACEKSGISKSEWHNSVKPIMDVIKLYYNHRVKLANEEQGENSISPEIMELINIKEPQEAQFTNDPFLQSMTRKKADSIANFGNDRKIKVLKKKGNLGQYHAAVLNTAIKSFRSGKVTKDGYIVLTENQAIKTMLGTDGTPSDKQKEDFRQAWEDMREESFTYETSETMAQIMGITPEQLEEFVPGIKPQKTNIVDDYFIQGLKVIRRQTVNGRETDIYLIKPSDIVKKCIELFPWYETVDAKTLRVLAPDKNGNLKSIIYSKQRIEIQTYILSWLSKYRNTRAAGRNFSPYLQYEIIFTECGLDMTHREKVKRNKKSVHLILDHLQRCGHIAKWEEYKVKTGEIKGVKVTLFKERYE